jgi:chromosomal replication initiation ATPase DnaA
MEVNVLKFIDELGINLGKVYHKNTVRCIITVANTTLSNSVVGGKLTPPLNYKEFIEKYCKATEIPFEILIKKRKSNHLVFTRNVLKYFLKKRYYMTLKSVADMFNQDHTTIIHNLKTVENLIYSQDVVFMPYYNLGETIFNQKETTDAS